MSQFADMTDDMLFDEMSRLQAKMDQKKLDRLSYAVLCDEDKNQLELEVIRFLKEGWKPCGGIAITYHEGRRTLIFSQAMIRE